jgi:1-acyl-sn-glycerol-3-phosphate acyltransferase
MDRHSSGSVALRHMLAFGYRAVARLEVEGHAHIPRAGGCLLVFNHLSNFDPHLIFTLMPRRDAGGLVAADYRRRPAARWLLERAGAIWLERGRSDRQALAAALARLRAGWLVGLAPEGGRSRSGALGHGRHGAAFLAEHAGVPILPVAVTGTERIAAALPRLHRVPVRVRFGAPFRLPALDGVPRRERLAAHTDTIMHQIAALLPPAYRGVYAARGAARRHG